MIVIPYGKTLNASSLETITSSNPFVVTGFAPITCYNVYVRSICSATDTSSWSIPFTFTTLPLIVVTGCGGQFIDNVEPNGNYISNSDNTYTIYPTNSEEVVTDYFYSFDIEPFYDGMYVYNGSSIVAAQFFLFRMLQEMLQLVQYLVLFGELIFLNQLHQQVPMVV